MPSWVELYLDAAKETDADKVPGRVATARDAMETRLEDLGEGPERLRIEEALYGLTSMELESWDWPRSVNLLRRWKIIPEH